MDITYFGHSSFRIKGKHTAIVTDPFDSKFVGLKFPKVEADIVLVSHNHQDHNAKTAVGGSPFIIEGPGEYEVKGVTVEGYSTYHDNEKGAKRGKNTIYRCIVDGVSILHVGDLGEQLSSDFLEKVGDVAILMVPVGGFYTISAKEAKELVGEIEPHIVIPMHYGRTELEPNTFSQLEPLSSFLKEMGKEAVTPVPKLSITKDKLPEEMQVVILA